MFFLSWCAEETTFVLDEEYVLHFIIGELDFLCFSFHLFGNRSRTR